MSDSQRARAFAQGRIKRKQPLTLQLPASAPPRNPVARALSARASGAGKHVRSEGAQRRADRMALLRLSADAPHDR